MNKILVWLGLSVLILGLVGAVVASRADDIMDTGNNEIGDKQMMYVYGGVAVLVVGAIILLMGLMTGAPPMEDLSDEYPEEEYGEEGYESEYGEGEYEDEYGGEEEVGEEEEEPAL